jgi:hypothetical protein
MDAVHPPVVLWQADPRDIPGGTRTAATAFAGGEQRGDLVLAEEADEVVDAFVEGEAGVAVGEVVRFPFTEERGC